MSWLDWRYLRQALEERSPWEEDVDKLHEEMYLAQIEALQAELKRVRAKLISLGQDPDRVAKAALAEELKKVMEAK